MSRRRRLRRASVRALSGLLLRRTTSTIRSRRVATPKVTAYSRRGVIASTRGTAAEGAARCVLRSIRRSFSPAPWRHGRVCHDLGVVGSKTHQRREPEPLLVGDSEPQMLVQHPLIAAELF